MIKKIIFRNLVKGKLSKTKEFKEIMEKREEIPDDKTHYFFTMIMQPLIWELPISVIHLTKSINGHFSLKEVQDIMILSDFINSHPNFEMKYFAADGAQSLDEFHETAFAVYEKYIKKVIDGEMTLDNFFQYIKTHCRIIPILDLFHGEKSGRNRLMNNILKLGEDCNLISAQELKKSLGINDKTLNDKSSIGRMNDEYPLHLFRMDNVLKEFKQKHNSSALYLLVFTIILEVFRNIYIDINFRIDLSKLALFLLLQFYQNCYNLPTDTALKKNAKSHKKYV